jgi:hypothetical protein
MYCFNLLYIVSSVILKTFASQINGQQTQLKNDDDENEDNFAGVTNETVEDKTFCEIVKNLSSEGHNTSSNSSIVPLTPPRSSSNTSNKGDASSPAQHLRSPL